jgi:hypothetical protein
MESQTRRVINDLRLVACATHDPFKRAKLLKIIERFSNQTAWPDDEEIMSLRIAHFNK